MFVSERGAAGAAFARLDTCFIDFAASVEAFPPCRQGGLPNDESDGCAGIELRHEGDATDCVAEWGGRNHCGVHEALDRRVESTWHTRARPTETACSGGYVSQ